MDGTVTTWELIQNIVENPYEDLCDVDKAIEKLSNGYKWQVYEAEQAGVDWETTISVIFDYEYEEEML